MGSGSRLVRLLLEWPSAVPGRDDLLGLSIPPAAPDTLRLKAVGGPAKLWRLRGVLDITDGRWSRLYGGGSRSEDRAGVGEDTFLLGLREPKRLETRLVDRRPPGIGDADVSRRRELENGIVDDGRGVRASGADDFRNVEL